MSSKTTRATRPHRRFAAWPAIVAGVLGCAWLLLPAHPAAADDGAWFSLAVGSCDAPSFTSEVTSGQTVLLLSGGLMANAPLDYSVSPYGEASRPPWWSLAQTVHADSSGSVCVEAFATAIEDYGTFLVTVNGLDSNQRQYNPPSQGLTVNPAAQPTETPTPEPSETPSSEPTEPPAPTESPTPEPSETPMPEPTESSTPMPTETSTPVASPTEMPVSLPIESSPSTLTEAPAQNPLPEPTLPPAGDPAATAQPELASAPRPAQASTASHAAVEAILLTKIRAGIERLLEANWLAPSHQSQHLGVHVFVNQAFRGVASIHRMLKSASPHSPPSVVPF